MDLDDYALRLEQQMVLLPVTPCQMLARLRRLARTLRYNPR